MKKESRRYVSLDIMRIIATLSVVMIHITASFVFLYDFPSIEFVMSTILDSISHMAVPLFLMISGALLLDEQKELNAKMFWMTNLKKIVLLLFFWSISYAVLYQVFFRFLKKEPLSIVDFFKACVLGHYHLWFLYMLIGIYLIIPFLRMFVKIKYQYLALSFIVIALLTQFIQPLLSEMCLYWGGLETLKNFLLSLRLEFFGSYTTYCVMGWYISHVGIKSRLVRYAIYFSGLCCVMIIIAYILVTKRYESAYEGTGILIFVYTTATFLLIDNLKFNFTERVEKKLIFASKLTFGVYIIHPILLTVIQEIFPYKSHFVLYVIVLFLSISVGAFIICALLSKIPYIRKAIRM